MYDEQGIAKEVAMQGILFSIILGISLGLSPWAFAEIIEAESKVVRAIIYTDSAQISRQVQVNVQKGLNEVIFTNVPENLNEATLSVSAKGEVGAKILDAKIKKIFLERPQSEQVRKLEDEIRELEDRVTEFNHQQNVIAEEREFLRSIRLYAAQQIPEDLVTKIPQIEELNSLNNFLKEKWQDTYIRELEIKRKLRKVKEKLEKLRKDLAQLRQARSKERRVISIELEAERAGLLTVSASYLIYQANWYPEYDARLDYERGKVELTCLGIVKQTSGEDWQDIELTLSTAKPTISGKMPELSSWILRPYPPPRPRRLEGRIREERLALKPYAPAPAEEKVERLLFAEVEERLTAVNYRVTRKVDIKSDGTKHRLAVFAQDFPARFQYSATPKLSPYAYLVTKVINEREQLLPASVRIFLNGVYVGSSSVEAIGKGEEFDLYLGIDEGVKIKREKIKEETKEVWIAGIKRRNKVIKTTYKVTVENYKPREIKINLFDHIPVSESDQIVVKALQWDPQPTEKDYEDRRGLMRWELDIAPGKKKEIIYTYQVEHPRDMDIRW